MFKDITDYVEESISVVLMAVLLVVLSIQVFTRFVLNDPAIWTEEVSRLLFIYLALFGSSAAIKSRSHVRIDFFVNFLPTKIRMLIAMILDVIIVGILVVLVKLGYDEASRQSMLSMVSLDLKMTWFYAVFPITMGLMVLRLIQRLFIDIKAFIHDETRESVRQKPRV
ncbi:TRAP transporter small permease [Reinekea sp.]|jgi:TRAP-type C4-dicarboxylate transport system permease small subunit|uniref:TRAP transporter small permease n=1 Tax=Reinekea sp. TaxID=1970455 RepID=UPI00398A07AF